LRVKAFSLASFAVQNGDVVAVGTLSAILTSATGAATSIVTTVALPVGVRRTTDENLHLDLGPMALDLFGLQVNVSPLVFDIIPRSGAGHRLGDVAGLIDDPPRLATVLNQILEAL
jgi:hypothetical protein